MYELGWVDPAFSGTLEKKCQLGDWPIVSQQDTVQVRIYEEGVTRPLLAVWEKYQLLEIS